MIDPKPQLRPSITHRVSTILPALQLRWSPTPRADENPKEQIVGATYEIDADGGDTDKVLLTLTEVVKTEAGASGTNLEYEYDGGVLGTIGALVDAINKANHGFTACVAHALTSLDIDSDAFTDVAATALPAGGPDPWVSTLVRTGANIAQYLRVGNPRFQDNGRFLLVRFQNIVANATGAVGTLYEDPQGGTPVAIRSGLAPTTAWKAYIDNSPDRAEIVRGPLVLEQNATATAGLAAELTLVQAEA